MSLISDLLHFREEAARREGIESFKVLSKANLDAIAIARPKSKEELTQIKGIKDAKYNKYGQALLAIVAAHTIGEADFSFQSEGEKCDADVPQEPSVLSVNIFLESINTELSGFAARIQGEVTDMNIWQNRVVFFTLKDTTQDSVLKCSISYQHYELSGVSMSIGTEIIVEGYPKIYKPRGELSFQVMNLELFGEGALKKAYDELYKKLEIEGAFDPSQKKSLPQYPERIALITSQDGAALGDFQMNIGRFGLKIDLYPSGVEGSRAIHELIAAVRAVTRKAAQYDVLVIVRGGGGLESLQAFNNEVLVRSLLQFPIPVLAGIGHEKDITLASLVADRMESTPTACALTVTSYWEAARENVYTLSEKLPRLLEQSIFVKKELLSGAHQFLFRKLVWLKEQVTRSEQNFLACVDEYSRNINNLQAYLVDVPVIFSQSFEEALVRTKQKIQNFSDILNQVDPARVLALGYSILRKSGVIITDTKDIQVSDILEIRLNKGSISTQVTKID